MAELGDTARHVRANGKHAPDGQQHASQNRNGDDNNVLVFHRIKFPACVLMTESKMALS
jgi:hypothetical protein